MVLLLLLIKIIEPAKWDNGWQYLSKELLNRIWYQDENVDHCKLHTKPLINSFTQFSLPHHTKIYKCLANAKKPCDCRVLCLRLKSSLCSCAHSISDMTSFGCRDQGRDSVHPVLWMSAWRNSRKRGSNYGNQTISSTRPSCWIQISTVDAINIAGDRQMFMILTGELSW